MQNLANTGNLGKHCARFSVVMYTSPGHDGRPPYLFMNMSEKSCKSSILFVLDLIKCISYIQPMR